MRRNNLNKETKQYIITLFQKHCNGRVPTSVESFWQADEFLLNAGVILDELCEAVNLYEDKKGE